MLTLLLREEKDLMGSYFEDRHWRHISYDRCVLSVLPRPDMIYADTMRSC